METLTNFLTDIKAAWIVAVTTGTTGTATFLDFIPDDIGKLATMISMVLGVVLIISHRKKMTRDQKMGELDFKLKIRQLDELIKNEKKDPL